MFAVIKTGGKQYKVQKDDKFEVEKLQGKAGDTVTLDEVLFIGDDKSSKAYVFLSRQVYWSHPTCAGFCSGSARIGNEAILHVKQELRRILTKMNQCRSNMY